MGITPGRNFGRRPGGPGDQDVREHSIQEPPPERVLPDERSSEKMLRPAGCRAGCCGMNRATRHTIVTRYVML